MACLRFADMPLLPIGFHKNLFFISTQPRKALNVAVQGACCS